MNTLASTLRAEKDLSTFADIVAVAGRLHVLDTMEPLTVFAPTNRAMREFGVAAVLNLQQDERAARAFVARHLFPGAWDAADLVGKDSLLNFAGEEQSVTTHDTLRIGDARVTDVDMPGRNGVVHKIDRALRNRALVALLETLKNTGGQIEEETSELTHSSISRKPFGMLAPNSLNTTVTADSSFALKTETDCDGSELDQVGDSFGSGSSLYVTWVVSGNHE